MNMDKNRKRTQDSRWIAFQSILAGIVIIMVVGLFCFMMLTNDADPHSGSHASRRGLGFFLFTGIFGLWMIVRGVIYLIRALSGDENYAKNVENVVDKFGSSHEAMMKKKVGNASMYNVLVLLCWVFLFLAVLGAIVIGYLFWKRPR